VTWPELTVKASDKVDRGWSFVAVSISECRPVGDFAPEDASSLLEAEAIDRSTGMGNEGDGCDTDGIKPQPGESITSRRRTTKATNVGGFTGK
jgi:hypothetical protein